MRNNYGAYDNSVRLSVLHAWIVTKQLKYHRNFFTVRPIILAFRHQGLLRKSDGFTP